MLRLITWGAFLKAILIVTVLYYGIVLALYYRKDITDFLKARNSEV